MLREWESEGGRFQSEKSSGKGRVHKKECSSKYHFDASKVTTRNLKPSNDSQIKNMFGNFLLPEHMATKNPTKIYLTTLHILTFSRVLTSVETTTCLSFLEDSNLK